ncbi:MAG: hypothetical protein K9N51_11010 [Candidatus Pacebacteria bacterium]|nr:hypothetical protein [Candidatus Paceibacterota bacterium]
MKKVFLYVVATLCLSFVLALLWEAAAWRLHVPLAPGIVSRFSAASGERGYDLFFYDMLILTFAFSCLAAAVFYATRRGGAPKHSQQQTPETGRIAGTEASDS